MVKAYLKRSTTLLLLLAMLLTVLLPVSASAAVKVSAPKQFFVDIGGTAQINVVTSPAADLTTLGLTYKSANEQIATVDSTGLVSGIAKGSTTITVQYGKKSFKVTALVSDKGVPYTDGATFSIEYPESWTFVENYIDTDVLFLSPSPNEQGKENFGVTVKDLPDMSIAVDEYTKLMLAELKRVITDFKLLSNKKITIGGHQAHSIVYTFKMGIYTLKGTQVYAIANNKVFILTYTAKKNAYEKYNIEQQKMLSSFRTL